MKCSVPARVVLGIMSFFMFVVTQMIRTNMYIAIIAIMNDFKHNSTQDISSDHQRMQWTEEYKGIVLGAFFWCSWLTEVPGGLLAQRFGGKRILGVGVLVAAIANFFIPLSTDISPIYTALLRCFQGLALGVTWPAMHCLSSSWIPKTERSRFMTTYYGTSVGTSFCYLTSGQLIASFGWAYVFHFTGFISLLWVALWWILVFDSPQTHPKISEEERKYLHEKIDGICVNRKTYKTPWRSILLSAPFWAVFFASQGIMWGSIITQMQMPSYFDEVHTLDIKTNGLLLAIPDMVKFLSSFGFSALMDYLLKTNILTLIAIRKISVTFSTLLPAICLYVLSKYGSRSVAVATLLLVISSILSCAYSSGHLANIVDISPNFAGTILGIIKTTAVIPGAFSPIIISMLSSKEANEKWFLVFTIVSIIYVVTCLIYLLFGSGDIQPWNEITDTKQKVEMDDLLNKNIPVLVLKE